MFRTILDDVEGHEQSAPSTKYSVIDDVRGYEKSDTHASRSVQGYLILEDGTTFAGTSFGYEGAVAGEVVFSTGMVGYPEALTDASFAGQILTLTYPLIGNYGVPEAKMWESDRVQVAGLIVSNYIDTPSHEQSTMTLGTWLQRTEDSSARNQGYTSTHTPYSYTRNNGRQNYFC